MVTYSLKKSYQHKNLEEIKFQDLWNSIGVFTTMYIFGKPAKILFFNEHIKNLIKSLKVYKLHKPKIEKNILKLIKLNLNKNKKYNHLLRVAVNSKIISISLRKKIKPKLNFSLNLVKYKRVQPEFKNLKYKKILNYLSKMDASKSDIALCVNKKILESGTSNILFIKNNKIYSPINKFYKGITYRFFEKKIGPIIKKNIFINEINNYEEIILIGSGKGVVSANSFLNTKWKRKSLKFYKIFLRIYKLEILKCNIYK